MTVSLMTSSTRTATALRLKVTETDHFLDLYDGLVRRLPA